jgi:small subunit ribosomal protein S1
LIRHPEKEKQRHMEQSLEQPTQQPEWFENFIAPYDTQNPQSGQFLEGTVVRIDPEGICLDLGLKREILLSPHAMEHVSKEYLNSLSLGSQVPVYVVSPASEDNEIEISLSRGLEQKTWEKAENILQQGEILTLEVVGHNRGGLILKYEGLRGFVPFSLVPELQGIRNPKRAESIKNNLVGTQMDVKITELDQERRRLILSADAAQQEKRMKRLEAFKRGQVVNGHVVKLVDFGVFIDLDGIDGLIHVSQLAWKKVKHPSECVKVGDEFEVKVIEIDHQRHRIGLSRKALLPGPWQTISNELKAGDYVEGIVTRLVEFGAFVKLPQGIEGLIHTSQIGYSSHQVPQNAVKSGDKVLLKVLEIKPDRKRIALSMRQVPIERQIAWSMDMLEKGTVASELAIEPETTITYSP